MNKSLFPAQQQFPSCFVLFSAEITLSASLLVSASLSDLGDGPRPVLSSFAVLNTSLRSYGGGRLQGPGMGVGNMWRLG